MKNYIGIDLGTTNSAICSFDGIQTRVWKSPEQNDVTPSVIYMDKRSKYFGKRAYDNEPHNPGNSAKLFKRFMGTSTPIEFSSLGITMSPEECSAEILKVLFGYLPEEIRNDPETGTVITVPAAFNQLQKEATKKAASLAGIGKVALMQEPVAAVMSVMKSLKTEGIFIIYDLGGGTLDISIAESISGRVNLLSEGGIAMCGGRDFDRSILNNVVKPWLIENFELPDNLSINEEYKSLLRLCNWAIEKAKIELSSNEEALISLSENEIRLKDIKGQDIYLDITLNRTTYDQLIEKQVKESIQAIRDSVKKAGINVEDLEKIVFVGGPTNYKPLRDKISFEIGIQGGVDVNPMTAVAEGASIFSESIDWSSKNRARKSSTTKIINKEEFDIEFQYNSRSVDSKARIRFIFGERKLNNGEYQIDSLDTGWSSGRIKLEDASSLDLDLSNEGENEFKVYIFDSIGNPINLTKDKILITKVQSQIVGGIPSSNSIGIETLQSLGGSVSLDYLVRASDPLPKTIRKIFKTSELIKAGTADAIRIKLWEGDIESPITDNRYIGPFLIEGRDLEEGTMIPIGSDIICDFEILDSGNITITAEIPSVQARFDSGKNLYASQEGQYDFSSSSELLEEKVRQTITRLEDIQKVLPEKKLNESKNILEDILSKNIDEYDPEETQKGFEEVQSAKKVLAEVKRENLEQIRQIDLDSIVKIFNNVIKQYATESEIEAFKNLVSTAQRAIDSGSNEFESYLEELRSRNFSILWREDWFVLERFSSLKSNPHLFVDKVMYRKLITEGSLAAQSSDINTLRGVVASLYQIKLGGSENEIFDKANIIRG